jgi:formylmethanofuran dehydrogenase subunit E
MGKKWKVSYTSPEDFSDTGIMVGRAEINNRGIGKVAVTVICTRLPDGTHYKINKKVEYDLPEIKLRGSFKDYTPQERLKKLIELAEPEIQDITERLDESVKTGAALPRTTGNVGIFPFY